MKKEDKGREPPTETQEIISEENSSTIAKESSPPLSSFTEKMSKTTEKKVEAPRKTSNPLQEVKFCDYGLGGKVCSRCGSKKITDSKGIKCAIADEQNCPMLKK